MIYQVMPDLSPEEFDHLKGEIEDHGVMVAVEYDEDGNILDGHHRVRACEELGIAEWPRIIRSGMSEEQKRSHSRAMNLARRHLSRDQRQALIREQLIETPARSDRQIAAGLGVSHHTVGAQRDELQRRGQIAHVSETIDTLGRVQPRTKQPNTQDGYEEDGDDEFHGDPDDPLGDGGYYGPLGGDQEDGNSSVLATKHTGDEESYTPSMYVEAARDVMGRIDLDPASNPMAQKTVMAARYHTKDDDGLAKHWSGTVFMNPPYTARVINKFIDKVVTSYADGDIEQAIILTNNNTDTSWFHACANVASAVCFTSGRINFLKRDGSKSSPTNGQCFFYLGDDASKFSEVFSEHGLVMVKA